jgi:3-hydroxybutyryl-CoA dehydrogenase
MGAFELTDLIGHDVNYAVTCSVFDAYYGDFRFQPSLIQKELVDAGRFGRKSGRGFYDYAEGAERPAPQSLPAAARPECVVVEGDLGPASALIERIETCGVQIVRRDGAGLIRVGEAVLALSDGRLAAERARDEGLRNLAVFDLALDYAKATRLAVAFAAGSDSAAREAVAGLLQAAGLEVTEVTDSPALVVLRTVAMLANEAADAVLQGVGTAADIDLAMCAGVNYPKGPLAWADAIGVGTVLSVLDNLQRSYGEDRYRPSLLLRRLHCAGERFHG